MVATPHILVGAACACRVRTVGGGLAVGFLTHMALDAVPHRDYRWNALGGLALAGDLALGAVAARKLAGNSPVILAGAFGGALPDALRFLERSLGVTLTRRAHETIHTLHRPPAWLSAAVQALTILGALAALRACPEPDFRPGA